jgi:hypothetical protein
MKLFFFCYNILGFCCSNLRDENGCRLVAQGMERIAQSEHIEPTWANLGQQMGDTFESLPYVREFAAYPGCLLILELLVPARGPCVKRWNGC